MKKRIIVDFDNTIYNTDKALVELYNKKIKYPKPYKSWEDITELNYLDIFGGDNRQEMLNDLFKSKRLYKESYFFNDFVSLLKSYSEKDFEIIVCTVGNYENISNKLILLRDVMPFALIVPIVGNSVMQLSKEIIDMRESVFFDDSYPMLKSTNAEHKILVQFGKDKNRLPKEKKQGLVIAKNINDIKNALENIFK